MCVRINYYYLAAQSQTIKHVVARFIEQTEAHYIIQRTIGWFVQGWSSKNKQMVFLTYILIVIVFCLRTLLPFNFHVVIN